MREAVIVSTARTPIGRAYRGAFNATPSPTLAGHAIDAAVARAGIDGAANGRIAIQQGSRTPVNFNLFGHERINQDAMIGTDLTEIHGAEAITQGSNSHAIESANDRA